jgi:hypothetical protein
MRDTCALSIFVCALGQDHLSRRAYTTASLSPARSITMRFNLGYKFAHLSGYEMLRKTELLHPPNEGCQIKLFHDPIVFLTRQIALFRMFFRKLPGDGAPALRARGRWYLSAAICGASFSFRAAAVLCSYRRRPGIGRASLSENRPEGSL